MNIKSFQKLENNYETQEYRININKIEKIEERISILKFKKKGFDWKYVENI